MVSQTEPSDEAVEAPTLYDYRHWLQQSVFKYRDNPGRIEIQRRDRRGGHPSDGPHSVSFSTL